MTDSSNTTINDSISFSELYFIIRKRFFLITSIIFLTFLIVILYTLSLRPIYKSSALLMITDPSSSIDIFNNTMHSEKNFINNEIEILDSWTVSENTVKRLLESDKKNDLFLFGTKKYKSNWYRDLFYFDEELVQLKSFNALDKSIFITYIKALRHDMDVENEKNTDILKLSFSSIDPDEASFIVNTILDEYKKLDLQWETGEMSHLKSFLVDQISKKEVEVDNSENLLKDFQEKEKIFAIDQNSQLLLENLISSESELYNIKAESNILDERKKYIQKQLTNEEKKLVESVSNTVDSRLLSLKNEIIIKETELISVISQQGENHIKVTTLRSKIEGLKDELQAETEKLISKGLSISDPIKFRQSLMDSVISINAYSAMLDAKIKELEKLVVGYEDDLSTLPTKILKFASLTRNLNIDNQTYSLMRNKLEETRIKEASQIGNIRIIDQARPSTTRVSPSLKYNALIGVFLGLMLAAAVVYFIEFFDGTIKYIEELDNFNLSILAIIPAIDNDKKNRKTKKYQFKKGKADKIQRRLLTREDPKSPISEAYRGLRTSLSYLKNKNKVILVSSSGPGEGKTTTIANLAITYANLGKKTILIDTDLRKPVLHKIFSINREPGISEYLNRHQKDYGKIINSTDIENLSVISSGISPPNPSEILSSNAMVELIDDLKKKYDVILLDSPPILAVTDTLVSMRFVDQFFIVIRASKTEKAGLKRSIELLKQANAPLEGIVINAVDSSSSYGGGYYYNYYQYYYGSDS